MATPLTNFVTCDECREVFDIAANSFVRRREDDPDIEETGMTCPVCKTEFVAYRTNSPIRLLQDKAAKEREKYRRRVARGVDPKRAEKGLKRVLKQLEVEFLKLNPGAKG